MNPKVDAFVKRAPRWRQEMEKLRAISLDCGLSEDLKWGKPCFSAHQGNIAIIQPFKEHCGFMFFKGALLKDPQGLLERPGENSHIARRMMFASEEQIVRLEPRLRAFIAEAVEAERAGLKVQVQKNPEPLPDELGEMFERRPGLKQAFEALTPGKQRAYVLHISSAKQSATRVSRIEKCVPRILEGKGLMD